MLYIIIFIIKIFSFIQDKYNVNSNGNFHDFSRKIGLIILDNFKIMKNI